MLSIMSVLLFEMVTDCLGLSPLSKYSAGRMFVHLPANAQPSETATKRIYKKNTLSGNRDCSMSIELTVGNFIDRYCISILLKFFKRTDQLCSRVTVL